MSEKNTESSTRLGYLSIKYGVAQTIKVCKSNAGFYIGTIDKNGCPNTRESVQYYQRYDEAQIALQADSFTQKMNP